MFKSALVKLTGLYLLIIMTISVFFSTSIYRLAAHEFGRGYRMQTIVLDDQPFEVPVPLQQRLNTSRQELIEEAQSHLLSSLLFTNIAILLIGGVLSFLFARKTLEPIEKAHQSLEQFTSDASHELRTPLAAMKSEIEVALMQPKLSASDAREVLKSNLEEVDALTKLSSNLLSLARLEEPNLEVVVCNVEQAIAAALKKVAPQRERRSVTLTNHTSKQKLEVFADKAAFEEALVILLDNAIKYSPEGGVVQINASQQKNAVLVSVRDEGVGIKIADQAKIFERFYQADTARSRDNEGHGLGLAIAKSLIERQSGSIRVKSVEGKGSTFTIVLPKA